MGARCVDVPPFEFDISLAYWYVPFGSLRDVTVAVWAGGG